ncbi:MAG: choice-of-anchor D domain-containing protein [Candidatus Acidiferrales bacterium]
MIRDRIRRVLAVSLVVAVVGVPGIYALLRGASMPSIALKNVPTTAPTRAPVSAGVSHMSAPEESVPRRRLSEPSKEKSPASPKQPIVSVVSARASKVRADSYLNAANRKSNRNARGGTTRLDSAVRNSFTGLSRRPAALPLPQSGGSPPNPPTSNSPADGVTGVSTSPTLNVNVTDPNSQNLTVNFYGKVIPSATPGPNFSIVALPDTQYYSAGLQGGTLAMFNSQTQWIVNNRVAQNIAFVIGLGDIVQNGNNGGNYSEWINANSAVSILDDPTATGLPQGIPYSFGVGNHDQGPGGDGSPDDTAGYNQYFGFSRYSSKSYYGGHYGTDNDNHYELFSAGGMDFIVINMAYVDPQYNGPELTSILAWANGLLQTYSSRRAIVVSHYFINSGFNASWSNQGLATYNALKGNPNLFLMLCGHVNPPEGQRADVYNGNRVYTLLSDYQETGFGGDGRLRILTFSPTNNQIQVQTYSPYINQYETTSSGNFTIDYDMQGTGNNFTLLASNSGVPSGSSTSYTWPSLSPGSKYEWYVTVSNSSGTTIGPLWSFTTTGGSPDVTLSPSSLSFPSQPINTTSTAQSVTLSNTGSAGLSITSIAASAQYAQTNDCPISPSTLAVNGICTINVTFTPTAAGVQSGSITIGDSAVGSPQHISLSGTASTPAPVVSLSSGSLTFGNQQLSTTSAAQSVTLSNTGNATLNITSIVPSGDYADTTTCAATLAAAANCTISVTFTPKATGTRTGAVTITDSASGSPQTVNLTGTGVAAPAPVVTLSASSLTFGSPAVTVVQDAIATGRGSTTLAVAFGSNVTQNNLMVVGVSSSSGNTFASPAITDTLGSSWFLAVAENPGATGTPSQCNIYYAVVPSTGANTVTVHATGTNNLHLHIYEISGLLTSSVLDQIGSNFQSGVTAATVSTAGPTTAANEYVFAYVGRNNGTGTWTAGTGYGDARSSPNTTSATDAFSEDKIVSATGTQTAAATSSATDALTSVIATFKAAGGGTRVGTTSAAQSVTLSNTGSATLNITTIVPSGDYADTTTCAATLAVGANCTISVTFTPTATGTRAGAVTITDNAAGSPHIISLTGTGLAAGAPVVSLSASSLTFGNQPVNTTSATQNVTLSNTGTGTLSITSIVPSGNYADTTTCTATLATGANCTISVTFTPTASGTQTGAITITDSAAGSPQQISLTGTGSTPAPVVSLSSGSLTFGSQVLNTTSAAQAVTLTNTGNATLNITSIVPSGDYADTTTCAATLLAGSNCAINVTFTPTATGTRTGAVAITDNAAGSPHIVNLTGTGVTVAAPAVSLSPASLTFASQLVNTTSAAQSVTLSNTGNATLNITSIVPSGDYADTTTCAATVAAAASCTSSVTFTPKASGTRTGTVTITDNAAGSPHIVNLTGTATLTSSIKLTGKFTEAKSGSTSVSSQTVTNTGFAIASGDLIVVIVRIANAGESTTTCSDNVNPGNYAQAHYQEDTSNGRAMIHYYMANSASAPAGSLTITCRYPLPNHSYLGALDYSGAATSSPLDGHIGTIFTTPTASPSSGSITPTQSGDLFVGSMYMSESSTVTVSSESTGFTTELLGGEGTANQQHAHTADEVLGGASAQNYSPTLSSPLTTIDILTAYKAR